MGMWRPRDCGGGHSPRPLWNAFFPVDECSPGLGKRRELAKAARRHWTQDSTAIKAGRLVPVHFKKKKSPTILGVKTDTALAWYLVTASELHRLILVTGLLPGIRTCQHCVVFFWTCFVLFMGIHVTSYPHFSRWITGFSSETNQFCMTWWYHSSAGSGVGGSSTVWCTHLTMLREVSYHCPPLHQLALCRKDPRSPGETWTLWSFL